MTQDPKNPWRLEASTLAFETPWIAVYDQAMIDPAGKPRRYGVVRFKKVATGVLPIDDEGHVRLVGQWRVPLGLYSWEMPEGGCDPGEEPEEAARRELAEETGLRAGALVKILTMHLSNSITDEVAHLYLATDLSPGEMAPEETEVLEQRRIRFSEALGAVVSGEITDSLTVAAVLRAHQMAVSGALSPDLARKMLG